VYDNLDHIILTAALVKPRQGVFVDRTHWLLVLTTPLEIVVLALLFDPPVDLDGAPIPAKSRVILQPTPVCVSSDNVAMLRVVGTPEGRIFMGGRDGLVYELEYGIESGWSGTARKSRKKACKSAGLSNIGFAVGKAGRFLGFGSLVNHYLPDDGPVKCLCVDPTRGHLDEATGKRMGLLYVLMDPSHPGGGCVIEAYAVRPGGLLLIHRYDDDWLRREIKEFQKYTNHPDQYDSVLKAGGPGEAPTCIASIQVVSRHGYRAGDPDIAKCENGTIHLMAVTVMGARLYLSAEYPQAESIAYGMHQRDVPVRFKLDHVQPLPAKGLLERQLERGYALNEPLKIDATLPQRSLVTGNLCVLHTTESAVLTEGARDSTSAMLALGVDYAPHALPNRDHGGMLGQHVHSEGYTETVQVMPVERDACGVVIRVLAMAESPYPYGSSIFQGLDGKLPDDELITQQDQWPRELLCLKEDGLQSYLKLRPLEWLAIYLQYPQWAQFRDEMFQEYGQDEGCAMLFTLACGDFSLLPRESVLQSINREKIHATAVELLCTDNLALIGRPEAHQFALAPDASIQFDQFGAAVPSFTKRYSHRFGGLLRYTSRLLEPVWEYPITEVSPTLASEAPFALGKNPRANPDPNNLQDLRLRSRDQWNALVVSLDALIHAIERLYPASDLSPPVRHTWPQRDIDNVASFMKEYNTQEGYQATVDREREAARAEGRLVFGLYEMLKLSREAAKLFRILCRTESNTDAFFSKGPAKASLRFPMIVGKLYTNEQEALAALTFKELVTRRENRMAGKPLNKLLHVLVTTASDAGQNQFSDPFIRDCPSFFGQPDQSRLTAKSVLDEAKALKKKNPLGYEWKARVEDAMEEYRKVMFHVNAGEVGKFLSDLGRYADAVEISLLKMARTLPMKEKDELMEQSIKYVENMWQRKYAPERYIQVEPEMTPEEVDDQWRQCLGNALYFGSVQFAKDATFFYRLFEAFCRLGDTAKSHMVQLARTHGHLVDPHLYHFLEEYHLEDLYKAYEQAGRFEEAALQLKYLAEETVERRMERYGKLEGLGMKGLETATPPDLLERRVRWLSQAILCLQGTGMEVNGNHRSLSDLMQNLHDSREVLEVQVYLKEELLPVQTVDEEMKERLRTWVLTNTDMWWLMERQNEEQRQPLWQREHLYGLCLRVLALSDERLNERYVEKVRLMWHCIIHEGNSNNGQRGIMNDVERWGRAFCPLHSIRDEEGSVFPLQAIIDTMEQHSHDTAAMGLDPLEDSIGWVINTLHGGVKIPYMALFNRYKRLLSDPSWQPRQDQPQKQVHLLKVIAFLLKAWLASRREDDIRDLAVAQIDFEDLQIKLVANTPYASPEEKENLQTAFKDAMERRRHLNW